MIQKLDKKALALRLFGRDTEELSNEDKVSTEEENTIEPVEG